jgi:hypothetical protein
LLIVISKRSVGKFICGSKQNIVYIVSIGLS